MLAIKGRHGSYLVYSQPIEDSLYTTFHFLLMIIFMREKRFSGCWDNTVHLFSIYLIFIHGQTRTPPQFGKQWHVVAWLSIRYFSLYLRTCESEMNFNLQNSMQAMCTFLKSGQLRHIAVTPLTIVLVAWQSIHFWGHRNPSLLTLSGSLKYAPMYIN